MSETAEPVAPRRRPADTDDLDLRAYMQVLARRRWIVLGVLAAAVLTTLLVTLRQTKMYASAATLIIDVSAPKVLNSKDVQDVMDPGAGSYWSAKEYLETQYRVITSRAVAQRVVDKLQLAHDLRFLGLDAIHDDKAIARALEKVDAVSLLQSRLEVRPVKDSQMVRVAVEDRDPRWAATLANAISEAYITENLSVRSTTTQSASDWLEQQLGDLETKLGKSTDDLFKFKQSHDIVATSWEDRQNMVTQRLGAINDALTRVRVQMAQLSARNEELHRAMDAAGRDPAAESTELVAQNPVIPDVKARYLDAQVECADLATRYLSDHPKVEACAAKLAAARAALEREVRGTLAADQREYDEAASGERKLEKLLAATKAEAFGVNQYEKEYLELKRANDNNQRLYDMVLARLKETGVTGMLQMSNVRILDRAEPSGIPVSPRPGRNLILAMVLGLAGGIGLAFVLEMLDTSISTREQIEERLGLPFLGIIPALEQETGSNQRELVVHTSPRSAAAECVRSIRTNLLFMSPEKPLRTILVTSSGPGEGKTTTAAALAETMADSGNRVLLVDADMRRPRAHQIFETPHDRGLSSLIVGDGDLASAVQATAIANLWVLPCGPIPPNPAELLHTAAFSSLLGQTTGRFDRVIIDSPPAGVVSDAVVISAKADGVLLVLKAGQTSRYAATQTIDSLVAVKARVLGAVLNDLDLEDRRYGEYHYYYRSRYYGDTSGKDGSPA